MDAAVIWDGLGSSLVGGLLSGLVVFVGIRWTQRLSDRSARAAAQRAAADRLIIEVTNLRDLVHFGRGGKSGEFKMWPLRNELLTTAYLLKGSLAYLEASRLFAHIADYRRWVRAEMERGGLSAEQQTQALEFRKVVNDHGEMVVNLLQEERLSTSPEATRPQVTYPVLISSPITGDIAANRRDRPSLPSLLDELRQYDRRIYPE